MAKGNVGKEIDSKFDDAVETSMEGVGDEELDTFFDEAFEGIENEGGGIAEFDEDLGFGSDEGTDEGEGEEGEGTDESEGEEEPEGEGEEEEEEDGAEGEEAEGEEEEEDGEEDGEGEEEEEDEGEPFYDAERDFGKDAVPTTYKDRMALNHGLVAKVSYFKELNKRLEEAGGELGAISLPEAVSNDPNNLDQYADIEQVLSMDDENAKKMVAEMDSTLRNMKNKAERFEQAKENEEQTTELTKEYNLAQQDATKALDVLSLEIKAGMTNQEVIDLAYDKLDAFEADEDKLDELGQKDFMEELRKMEDAVFALEDFATVAAKAAELKESGKKPGNEKVTPQQMQSAFKEFMNDQPNIDMVKNNRSEMQKSLIQTAIRKGWKVATARDWLNNYDKFMDIVNANRAEKGLKKLKKGEEGESGKGSKKKGKGSKDGRAKKYAKKKPTLNTNGVSYSNRTGKKSVDKIDDELDQLAAQMTSGRAVESDY